MAKTTKESRKESTGLSETFHVQHSFKPSFIKFVRAIIDHPSLMNGDGFAHVRREYAGDVVQKVNTDVLHMQGATVVIHYHATGLYADKPTTPYVLKITGDEAARTRARKTIESFATIDLE